MALDLAHQTAAEFVARLRARYKEASREELARLAWWLYEKYSSGDITQAQIRTAFGLSTDPEWIAFRDRVIVLHDAWDAIRNAEGE